MIQHKELRDQLVSNQEYNVQIQHLMKEISRLNMNFKDTEMYWQARFDEQQK